MRSCLSFKRNTTDKLSIKKYYIKVDHSKVRKIKDSIKI